MDVVAKIDDEVFAWSIIKIYNYFFFVFLCCAKEGQVVENIESYVATSKIVR